MRRFWKEFDRYLSGFGPDFVTRGNGYALIFMGRVVGGGEFWLQWYYNLVQLDNVLTVQ